MGGVCGGDLVYVPGSGGDRSHGGGFHGNAVKTGLDVLLTAAVVSVGMILLGVELKRKGER